LRRDNLKLVAAQGEQAIPLPGDLHPLGDDAEPEFIAESRHGPDDLLLKGRLVVVSDEREVEFEDLGFSATNLDNPAYPAPRSSSAIRKPGLRSRATRA
jgi:hypothetical protein